MLLKKKKKGFIFSLDSAIALLTATILIGASFFYLSQVQTLNWSQPSIFVISMDTLNTLRIDNTFNDAIIENTNATLIEFMDVMFPPNICGNLKLYSSDLTLLLTANKTGCVLPTNTDTGDLYVARHTFVVKKEMYLADLRMWYD